MTLEQAVRELILGISGVTALVGTRVYQYVFPQGFTAPAVKVQLVDDPRTYHLRGPDGARRSMVQIDVADSQAHGYATATAVLAAIEDGLSGLQTDAGGSPPAFRLSGIFAENRMVDPFVPAELRQVRMFQRYVIWNRPMN